MITLHYANAPVHDALKVCKFLAIRIPLKKKWAILFLSTWTLWFFFCKFQNWKISWKDRFADIQQHMTKLLISEHEFQKCFQHWPHNLRKCIDFYFEGDTLLSQSLSKNCHTSHISVDVPLKIFFFLILDLNLLDWSSKNTMCVALCYSCHLLEMDRSSVHELINGENIQDDYISCLSFDDVGNYIGVGDNGGNLQVSFKLDTMLSFENFTSKYLEDYI